MSINILLADDHQIVRAGLRNLLEKESDMKVIAEAKNGRETVRLTTELSPDIVIMDIGMPELNGMEATGQIIKEKPGTRVIALSMHSDKQYVTGMFRAGASGYLLKDCPVSELVNAIRTVYSGRTYLSPEITGVFVKEYVNMVSRTDSPIVPELTDREREVLQLLAEGKSSKEIAGILYISVKTVMVHRQKIMSKLGLKNLPELTKYAIRKGVTSLEK